jgi:hypothetical protein
MDQAEPPKQERVIRVTVVPLKAPDPSWPIAEGPVRLPWEQVKDRYAKRKYRGWRRPKPPEETPES